MYLKEFLEVCRDDNILILDRKGNELIVGSKYVDVHQYLFNYILNISVRVYNRIYITIDYSSDMGACNEKTST